MKKSIYVLYTGGTIGMMQSENGYIPVSGYLQKQLAKMPEFHRSEMPYFTIKERSPLIDSSNITPADWQNITDDIRNHYDEFDGFVILHGTDTMAFTASALSFMFENLTKPIIITGSQIPLEALRSDGQTNLLNALYLAANYPIHEVGLFFNHTLYRGNRTIKMCADGFNAFASPNCNPLMEAGIQIKKGDVTPLPIRSDPLKTYSITPQSIGVIMLYPGLAPEVIAHVVQQPVKALILRSYGVGNAPEQADLLKVLHDAIKQDIIVVNLTQCIVGKVNMDDYATGHTLREIGVINGFDMTFEATLSKLHFLLSQNYTTKEVIKLMQTNLRGELTN